MFMAWRDALKIGQEAVLVTSSRDGNPNAIYVVCKGIVDEKILLSVCQMQVSLNNVKENNRVCLVVKHDREYYKIKGTATLEDSGKYFELAKERNAPGSPEPKFAMLVSIDEVYDLDNVKKLV